MAEPVETVEVSQVNSQWMDTRDSGEIICGVGNDCVIFPQNEVAYPQHEVTVPEVQEPEIVQYTFDEQDFVGIQEEVVCETWDNGQQLVEESPTLDIKVTCNPVMESDDVEIPLPQDQDEYTTMRPYPCDFCPRRFRKKANLMNHMVAHQTDRPHGCNLCGVRYRRKCDLVNHMKIHAYVPGRIVSDDDDDDEIPHTNENNAVNNPAKGRRKKSQSASAKKRRNHSSAPTSGYGDFDEDNSYNSKDNKRSSYSTMSRKKPGNSGTGSYSYVEEDVRLLSQPPPAHFMPMSGIMEAQEPSVPRWPVVDETRPYVCQHCGVGFAREKALASHARIHAGDSPFECDTCGEMFWDLSLLKEHSKMKHAGRDLDDLQGDNSGTYTGDDRFGEFHCETCGVGFHRQDLLKRHRRTHVKVESPNSAGETSWTCRTCDQSFPDQSDLLAHLETHSRYQPHRCMMCGECFLDAEAVAIHVRKRHARSIPPNACTLCGKICKDRRSLQKHTWVHSAERSFSCVKCGKRFHSRARLKRHMVSHRDKAVSCEECGLEFPDGRALINHRHSHNKEPSARQFSCQECGKTFGSRSSQQIHARIHTGERPYGCRFCWKAFADGGTLRKHERIHTGEKPYACAVCPRAFNQRVVLREHIRSHHSGPEPRSSSSHAAVYVCKVCAAAFSTSEQLCAHLIQHSDENTAKHRMPRLGPRKYKRRRKLNSHELNMLSGSARGAEESSGDDESDDGSSSAYKRKIIKKKYKQKGKSNPDENFESVVKTFESVIENLNSIVSHSKTEQPGKERAEKKKHKIKRRATTGEGKRPRTTAISNNNGATVRPVVARRMDFSSGGFVKSNRPAGEGRIRPRTKNVTVSTLAALKAVSSPVPIGGSGRVGPRTKNVNYHNVKQSKISPATFPKKVVKDSPKKSAKVRGKTAKNVDINSLIASEDMGDNKEVKVEFTCEMCSETFTKRSELLIHVPIHI